MHTVGWEGWSFKRRRPHLFGGARLESTQARRRRRARSASEVARGLRLALSAAFHKTQPQTEQPTPAAAFRGKNELSLLRGRSMSQQPPPVEEVSEETTRVSEETPVELYAEDREQTCSTCVTCSGSEDSSWTITQSIACLVASGCVVLPPEDFEEAVAAETPASVAPAVKAQ
mmetsp:Transcript_4311/g.14319  ORF Transcript_4311/g.14319 Transcript_4311/m.14319 type:complete len:173 (+) Transcript_4311:1010-1528(+)